MTVTLGFTGVGIRGTKLLETCLKIDAVTVAAICNRTDEPREAACERVVEAGQSRPTEYVDHESMLTAESLDGVVVSTPWRYHVPMAIDAMEAGVTPAIEVGPANSVQECWELVRTSEETGVQCMLLENHCFRRPMLALLEMVRENVFGELVHAHAGYCHDLRERLVTGKPSGESVGAGPGYRPRQVERRNADLYPTHGLGPVAKFLRVNRGNRFYKLTASASKSVGLADWAEDNLPADHPQADVAPANGDIVTTTITCANGETIVLTHDTSLPRPYSNVRRLQGTNGIFEEQGSTIHVEDSSPDHEWEDFEDYRDRYEHPLWERYLEVGVEPGHDGSDYLELCTFVECLEREVAVPVDVYDAAAWMAIAPLSEESIATGSDAVFVPDFTDGAWMHREPVWGLHGDVPADRLDSTTIL